MSPFLKKVAINFGVLKKKESNRKKERKKKRRGLK